MAEKNENNLDIECPHCSKDNSIHLSSEIKCKHCEKPLIGQKYKKQKLAIVSSILLIGGGYFFNEKFEPNRYPMPVEYYIVKSCVSADEQPLKVRNYVAKELVCLCSLQKTIKELDYKDYQKKPNTFLNTFEKFSRECM
jgi:DNA-directed RNA polymerase subunit RPC12/RpoP|tara:strand:+ start:645 stop:1061 length:417 start_codon:yes stop_codon:yes gene_type:complete